MLRTTFIVSQLVLAVATAADMCSVAEFGAKGDGKSDDTVAIQAALDSGKREVGIPAGVYLISRTLEIGSRTQLTLAKEATVKLADGAAAAAGGNCYLITNRDHGKTAQDITIAGGTWDGNCAHNPRGDEYAENSYGGVGICFVNIRRLKLQGLTMHNCESFAIKVGDVNGFTIEDITLDNDVIRPNQDGVHVGGFSQNGKIRRISATADRTPNDDMIALNADDDVRRHFNREMKLGYIRNVVIEDISAKDAYTFVRLLSNSSELSNIIIRRIRGGCRWYCINMNRWRFPKGNGNIRDILIQDVRVAKLPGNKHPLIPVSLSVSNARLRRFVRTDNLTDVRTLVVEPGTRADISADIRHEPTE